MPVLDRERVAKEQVLRPGVIVGPLDGELQIGAGIGDRLQQMHGADRHQRQVRRMRGAGIADAVGAAARDHPRQLQRRGQPAHIHHVRLQHVDHMAVDHVLPVAHVAILLAAGDVDLQRVRDLPRPVRLPVGARLLIMGDAVGLQHAAHLDGALHPETAVGIDHFHHAVSQRARHGLDDLLGPARPFIHTATTFCADPELEGVKSLLVAKAAKPVGLVGWGDVALHRRGIGPQPPGRAADQTRYRLAGLPPQKVPQRRVQARQRAADVGSGELVLALMHQRRDVQKIRHRIAAINEPSDYPGGHLPVQHLRRDVGMVGRHLAPAERPVLGGDPDKSDIRTGETLDPVYAHGSLPVLGAA